MTLKEHIDVSLSFPYTQCHPDLVKTSGSFAFFFVIEGYIVVFRPLLSKSVGGSFDFISCFLEWQVSLFRNWTTNFPIELRFLL